MSFEFFIARNLKIRQTGNTGGHGLNIALTAVVLAVVVMILSIAVVMGFKNEVTDKILNLDSHVKIHNAVLGLDDNYDAVNVRDIYNAIKSDDTITNNLQSMSLIAEKPAILKTSDDFKGVEFRGVDKDFDWTYLKDKLVEGRVPCINDSCDNTEVLLSKEIANSLQLKTGDKILTYFIDEKVKVRNCRIVGLYRTDFEGFDKSIILGNISMIQQINGWHADLGTYVGINLKNVQDISDYSYHLYSKLAQDTYDKGNNTLYRVSQTHNNNSAFFSWMSMLDMNVLIILVLMMIVSGFTLISALIMIVLERIRMIGTLKALGSTNRSIRWIFIYLTQKLIVKALVWGNVIGLGLALVQQQFHLIKLNADVYYMPYVPIHIDWLTIILLNVGVIIASTITLLGPSFIVSSIKPSSTMRFE